MNYLEGVMLGNILGELGQTGESIFQRRERENKELARQAIITEAVRAQQGLENWKADCNRAIGTIHNVRAKLNARVETEEELLAQLHEAGVSVPLSDPAAFTERATKKYFEKYKDKKVIEQTYRGEPLPLEQEFYIGSLKSKDEEVKWYR